VAAYQLLVELAQHGVTVEARGDRLRLRGRSAPPADLREKVLQAKSDLLRLLQDGGIDLDAHTAELVQKIEADARRWAEQMHRQFSERQWRPRPNPVK
jgi:hypothetical protein